MVGEFAYLKAVATSKFGAFLDWGLPKDLLVPFREQKADMVEGRNYLVFLFVDLLTKRIAASANSINFWITLHPNTNREMRCN